MSNGPTLPPQAYTREILTSAFNWLQTQPESVKKIASSPDALVGLFLRAQRFGSSSLENDAPVSSQNFMSDLKNLAEGLKQFEDPRETRRPAVDLNSYQQPSQPIYPTSYQSSPQPQPTAAMPVPSGLNERSRQMIHEVKTTLNLSSDGEALNMMVALAYKNLKALLS